MPSGSDSVTRTDKIRVLIVDDHATARLGLRAGLSQEPDMSVVGEAPDGLKAEELALSLKPDVITMDIFMPGRTGFETIACIKQKLPEVKVLVLTVSDWDGELFQAIKFGADGYLTKRSTIEEVVGAIRRIAAGEAVLAPRMVARVIQELREGHGVVLSPREQEVLDLVAAGLTNQQIAETLVISPRTVSVYLYRLLQKLHLKNRAQAMIYSLHHPTRGQPL